MSIIERMTGASISCDWLYSEAQNFEFFPIHGNAAKRNRVAAIYGRNGSGKSTIAQGFREYVDPSLPRTVELLPLKNGIPMGMAHEDDAEKFIVFDETYVENQVKIKEQGLEAIVLFGEQVALDQQIEEVQTAIDDLESKSQLQEEECNKYKVISDVVAPGYWLKKITQTLRSDCGWAEKKGININEGRQKAGVNEQEVDRIGQLRPTLNEQRINAEYDRLYALYCCTSSQDHQSMQVIEPHIIDGNMESETSMLLAKSIPKVQLSEREEELLEIFNIRVISDAKGFLSDISNSKCPTCLQDISDEHRNEMLSRVENILNRELEKFRAELGELLQEPIVTDDYSSYGGLKEEIYNNVQTCITVFNEAVEKHNLIVQTKIDNPFEAISYDASIGLIDTCDILNKALLKLEAERAAFTDAITQRASLKGSLLDLNDGVAHYEISEDYSYLCEQRLAKRDAEEELKSLKDRIAELEEKKRELDAMRVNIQIAVNDINNSLAYIFFSKDRLKLVLSDDNKTYHLLSNGKKVNPTKVSCGERNALALCYYFTEIAEETDVRTIYSDEVFLMIDDPVSSFDMENRIGIISFLRWKLGQILLGCPTSKILIMTHDISVLYDMQKAFDEIVKESTIASTPAEYCLFELDLDGIKPFPVRRHHEYTRLLEMVYDYALNGGSDAELLIGNTLRRVLEAFSTFLYKKGIADISYDQIILSELDEDKRNYFQNLMYRLVLHGESHYEEHVRGMRDMDFFSHLSQADKQRTARDVLCFMYLLHSSHIMSHLTAGAEREIKDWISNIEMLSNASTESREQA